MIAGSPLRGRGPTTATPGGRRRGVEAAAQQHDGGTLRCIGHDRGVTSAGPRTDDRHARGIGAAKRRDSRPDRLCNPTRRGRIRGWRKSPTRRPRRQRPRCSDHGSYTPRVSAPHRYLCSCTCRRTGSRSASTHSASRSGGRTPCTGEKRVGAGWASSAWRRTASRAYS